MGCTACSSALSCCHIAVFFVGVLSFVPAGAVEVIAGSSPLVQWSGRVLPGSDGAVAFDWLGAQFAVSIAHGSYLTATFDVDGMGSSKTSKLRTFVAIGTPGRDESASWSAGYRLPHTEIAVAELQSEYVLATALPTQATVSVFNNQSPAYSAKPLRLVNLTTDGTFVAPVLPVTMASRRVEFVGDSITAGTNLRRPIGDPVFGIPQAPACADYGLYSDYPLSYSSLLCQAFGANCSTIAWGGKGMYTNCCDESTTMPEYFQQTLGLDSHPPYNFAASGFVPDAVVINLGTNDFSGCKKYSPQGDECGAKFQAAFTDTYVQFMVNVTKWYGVPLGGIKFFAGVGPITVEYWNATALAVNQAKELGIQATLVDMQACNKGGGGCEGCATHPGIEGHRRMFEMTYSVMKDALNW